MQRECKFCDNHQQVNMEKPEGSEKWIVTNLDGSYHKHVKYGGNQEPQQQIQHAPIEQHDRKEAWNAAHQDNMDSEEQTRQTIRELIAELKAIEISLNNLNQTVKSYIQGEGPAS